MTKTENMYSLIISMGMTITILFLISFTGSMTTVNKEKQYVMINMESVIIKKEIPVKPKEKIVAIKNKKILVKEEQKKIEEVKEIKKEEPVKEEVKQLEEPQKIEEPKPVEEKPVEQPVKIEQAVLPDKILEDSSNVENTIEIAATENLKNASEPTFGIVSPKDNIVSTKVVETKVNDSQEIDDENMIYDIGVGNKSDYEYKLLEQYKPSYPEIAAEAGFDEVVRVTVKILIGLNGKIEKAEVVKSFAEFGFDEAAIDAAKHFRYTPIRYKGKIVRATSMLAFEFSPKK